MKSSAPLADSISYYRLVLAAANDYGKFQLEARALKAQAVIIHQQRGNAARHIKNVILTSDTPFASFIKQQIILERLTK